MKPIDRINDLLDEAVEIGLTEVERIARSTMRNNPRAKRFVMAMGCWDFYDRHGEPIRDDVQYLHPMIEFMSETDRYLKLTGNPMRIEGHTGELVEDW